MIPRNAPVDPCRIRRHGPLDGAADAADMLDAVATTAAAFAVRESHVDEHRSVITLTSGADEIRWIDFRRLNGGGAVNGTQPEFLVKRGGEPRLKVRLRNSALRTLVGAEGPEQMSGLAAMLADLCRSCQDVPRSTGVDKRIRLTAGAYLAMRDPPLRDDLWLGLGLRMPSPWSPASVHRASPGLDSAVSTDGFPRWADFSSRLPTLIEVVPSIQNGIVTVSIAPLSAPLLRPPDIVESLRLVSRWEGMSSHQPSIPTGATA